MSRLFRAMPETKALRNWYGQAGVRTSPRRFFPDDEDIKKAFFPRHLVPYLNHPLVNNGDEELSRYLAAQHLYQWLQFTMHFEVSVVCRAAHRIANGATGLTLSPESRLDAARIVVDEGYHSLYNLDVQQQLEARSGISALSCDFDSYLSSLDSVGDDLPGHRMLIQLLQVVVFETSITTLLTDIPPDETVIDLVRNTSRDHEVDERRHHAFFATFFKYLWGELDHTLHRKIATYLPHLLIGSLPPVVEPARASLLAAGFSEREIKDIVEDTYSQAAVMKGVRRSAAKTIQLFEKVGVLDIPGAREEFHRYSLIV
jgi:hypothetical protein